MNTTMHLLNEGFNYALMTVSDAGGGGGVSAIEAPPISAVQPSAKLNAEIVKMLGWLKWGTIMAAVAGLFICAIMMVIGRRGKSQTAVEGAFGIPWVLAGLVLLVSASAIVNMIV